MVAGGSARVIPFKAATHRAGRLLGLFDGDPLRHQEPERQEEFSELVVILARAHVDAYRVNYLVEALPLPDMTK
jgi:hypothetical protein